MATLTPPASATSVDAQLRAQRRSWRRLFVQVVVLTLFFAAYATTRAPEFVSVTLVAYLAMAVWTMARPIMGVYLVVFFTLLGDYVIAPWYPFAKGLSSKESISYVGDSLRFTPIELMLAVTIVAWALKAYWTRPTCFRRGALVWPIVVFGCLVCLGLMRAFIGAADTRIALFEGRWLLYLPILYLLIVQMFETRRQYVTLLLVAFVAVLGQALLALNYFRGLDAQVRYDLESLTEHSASLPLAALFIVLLASFVIPGCSAGLRWFTLLASIPSVYVFALSQRRSAAAALGVGVLMLLVVLLKVRPRALIWLVPLISIVTVAYLVAYWNSTGAMGLGAQAFKSVFAEEQLGDFDRGSNFYRRIEAFNLWYTVRAQPVTGIGFGSPFYRPWPMPYLPGFEFQFHIPHNTLLWIWLKLGAAGFVTVIYMIARAVQHGARSVVRLARGDEAALMMGAVAYVVMYTVFAYVDIGWDARSMVFLAIAMAWCGDYVRAERVDAHLSAAAPAPTHPVPKAGADRGQVRTGRGEDCS